MKAAITHTYVADEQQRRNNDDLVQSIDAIGRFIFAGDPVPTFTPPGPALYFRTHTGSIEVYKYNGAWVIV